MKRSSLLLPLLLIFSVILAPFSWAASAPAPTPAPAAAAPAKADDQSTIAKLATAVTTITGIAISPLLGTAGYGAYRYMSASSDAARDALPWFAKIKFWLPALLLVGICAAKDSFGAMLPPGTKKPLDVLETIENKVSGLVAAGAVIPMTMDFFTGIIFGDTAVAATPLPASLAMIPVASMDSLFSILTVPFAVVVFVFVWMASHAINVLILLSPWGAIDAVLKSGRAALLALLALSNNIDPKIGAALSLVVIVVAYFTAGWAFRLTVFGTIFSWEFVTRRKRRFTPALNHNIMFTGGNFPGVPVRTYGRLAQRADDMLEFTYRPWLFLAPRTVTLPVGAEKLAVGRGLFLSSVTANDTETLFLLPPRYRGHEEALVATYRMAGGVRPAGLRHAWSVMKELFGGAAAKTQIA